jgi:hypothetical protein
MKHMGEQFQAWWDLNMQGFGVSDELEQLLAKAFEGGIEAATGMVKSDLQVIDIMGLGDAMRKTAGGINDVGTPQLVVLWPTPPKVREEFELGRSIVVDETDDPIPRSKGSAISSAEMTAASLKSISKMFEDEYAKVNWDDIMREAEKKATKLRPPIKTPRSVEAREQLEELRKRVTKVKY